MISFWPQRQFNLQENEIWKHMTEIHCHILPGVDYSVENREEAFLLLHFMETEVELSRICFTPHTTMNFNSIPPNILKESFQRFRDDYTGEIKLYLASEYMLDTSFRNHLSSNMLLLGVWEKRKMLLVEIPRLMPPSSLNKILEEIFAIGYTPVIAHPERYAYLAENDCMRMKERGYLFQLNIPSLQGYYGHHAYKNACRFLNKEIYSFAGFDIHRYNSYVQVIRQLHLSRKRLDQLCRLLNNNRHIDFYKG